LHAVVIYVAIFDNENHKTTLNSAAQCSHLTIQVLMGLNKTLCVPEWLRNIEHSSWKRIEIVAVRRLSFSEKKLGNRLLVLITSRISQQPELRDLIQAHKANLLEMPLQDLPNELLLLIWDFLELREMNALILTCWQLHDTFNNILYRHAVEVCPGQVATWMGEKGQLDTLREFIKAGGDVTSNPQTTPLFAAAAHGCGPMIRALIEMGINLEMKSPQWKRSGALFKAAAGGHLSTVLLLLDAGAAVDARGSSQETALMAAAGGGHDESAQLLLARGADPAAMDYYDRPVLSYALEGGCGIPVLELLIQATPKY
jgi:ankyrin repeat protein